MVRPKWVIFDIGGVIIDTREVLTEVADYLETPVEGLVELFIPHIEAGHLGKKSLEQAWEDILAQLQRSDKHQEIMDLWWDTKRWVGDTRQLITELEAAGYNLCTFTNNWVGMIEKDLQEVKEFHLFHKHIESSVHGLVKPDPLIYNLVEKETEARGQELLFIDDTQENIKTAQNLGWQTFHYNLGNDLGKSSNNQLRRLLLP